MTIFNECELWSSRVHYATDDKRRSLSDYSLCASNCWKLSRAKYIFSVFYPWGIIFRVKHQEKSFKQFSLKAFGMNTGETRELTSLYHPRDNTVTLLTIHMYTTTMSGYADMWIKCPASWTREGRGLNESCCTNVIRCYTVIFIADLNTSREWLKLCQVTLKRKLITQSTMSLLHSSSPLKIFLQYTVAHA